MVVKREKAARSRTNWAHRHSYERSYRNADEAEWGAFLNGIAHISLGTHDAMMSEEATEQGGDETPGAAYMKRESVEESLQASVLEIIAERKELLGADGYPFTLENNSLRFDGRVEHPYLALLTICNLPSVSQAPFNKAAVAFEYLSLIAARSFLGENAKGWRFGWPRDNAQDLRVKDASKNLSARSGMHAGEWDWGPAAFLPENPTTKALKDAGLDFVAWVQWQDGGPAQLQLVGQCACGEDWKLKTHDLTLPQLELWMRVPKPPPVRALFTPRHTPYPSIQYKAPQAGLIFDRIRIVHALLANAKASRRARRFVKRVVDLRSAIP